MFGEKSYFYHKRRFLQHGIPMPDLPSEGREEEPGEAGGLAFAEEGEETSEGRMSGSEMDLE